MFLTLSFLIHLLWCIIFSCTAVAEDLVMIRALFYVNREIDIVEEIGTIHLDVTPRNQVSLNNY